MNFKSFDKNRSKYSRISDSPLLCRITPIFADFSSKKFSLEEFANSRSVNKIPKTKIICTIGPSTSDETSIEKLMESGMSVARFNLSHSSKDEHKRLIQIVRKIENKKKKFCAILIDTRGSKIRTGSFEPSYNGNIDLKAGGKLDLILDKPNFIGNETKISISNSKLTKMVKSGTNVFIDDGAVSLTVDSVAEDFSKISCVVRENCVLKEHKSVIMPGIAFCDLNSQDQINHEDVALAIDVGADMIAVSSATHPDQIETIRKIIKQNKDIYAGDCIGIIAKIENRLGIENFDSILESSDGIMVDRGDLGAEIPIDRIAIAQKMTARRCNAAGKIFITASQMLESMAHTNTLPTRAEASDIANSIFDGTDCVMLSSETAIGPDPFLATSTMSTVCCEAELSIDHYATFASIHRISLAIAEGSLSIAEANASSGVKASLDLKATLVVVLSSVIRTAELVAKYRPKTPIIFVTDKEIAARRSLALRGVFPLLVDSFEFGVDIFVVKAISVAKELFFGGGCDEESVCDVRDKESMFDVVGCNDECSENCEKKICVVISGEIDTGKAERRSAFSAHSIKVVSMGL